MPTVRDSGSKRRDVFDWQRTPAELPEITIDLSSAGPQRHLLEGGALELYALVRSPEEAVVTVTIVLRNTQPRPDPTSDKDVACWFQAGLSVYTEVPALVDRSKLRTSVPSDPDLASSELLYRNHMVFGAGTAAPSEWTHPTSKAGAVDE